MTAVALTDTPPVTWPLPTDFAPRPFQLEHVGNAVDRDYVFDIGLGGGKTTMALAVAEARLAKRVLVLCPKKVVAVWPEEIADNATRTWQIWTGGVIGARGPLKNPSVARRCEALIQANSDALILHRPFMAVINLEAVVQRQMHQLLLGTPWDMVIVDECHKIAGAAGKTSKNVAQVTARCRARGGRIILQTGTLMPRSGLSLYGQYRALDPEILGRTWTGFKARYAKYKVVRERQMCDGCFAETTQAADTLCLHCGGRIIPGEPVYMKTPRGVLIPDGVREDREDELLHRIAPHTGRVSQEELDAQTGLVETHPQLRTFTLGPDARTAYDELERHLITQVTGGTITAANAMVAGTRLAQVTSGFGKDTDTDEIIAIDDPPAKAVLLADELSDLDPREPVVVFARFHHDLDAIRQVALGRGSRYGEISGRSSDGLQGKSMSPDVDVVGVQPQAGGAGIDLTRSRLGIFYSSDFNLANYLQCKRRVLRQGQTRHVAYLWLAAEDSIDLAIYWALRHRKDMTTAILDRLNQRGDGRG